MSGNQNGNRKVSEIGIKKEMEMKQNENEIGNEGCVVGTRAVR